MPLIKVTDMAWGRLRAPDLDRMEEFLTRFGMTRSARTPSALYMRGTDPNHHIHVTEKGEPSSWALPITPRARTTLTASPERPAPRASRRSTSPAAASACA